MFLINGATQRLVICHVQNVCEALMLAEQTDSGGAAYFVNDVKPIVFKDFLTDYLATQKIRLPNLEISLKVARFFASFLEKVWKLFKLKGNPPIYNSLINTLAIEFITNDQKARKELGYKSLVSYETGMAEMTN